MKKLGQVWDSETGSFVSRIQAIPGTHFNRNMNLVAEGSKMVLNELPISKEIIAGAKTAKAVGEGNLSAAALYATGATGGVSTTIEPLNQRHPYKAIGRDIKLDNLYNKDTADIVLKGFKS